MKVQAEKRYKSKDVAALLRREIAEKRLNAHTAVPSTRRLSKRFGISTVTANKAINQLVGENLVYRVSGSGSYVKNDPPRVYKVGLGYNLSRAPRHFNTNLPPISPMWEICLQTFHQYGYEPEVLSYPTLSDSELGVKKLRRLDGLLLSYSYLDQFVLPKLRDFPGKIVIFEYDFIDGKLPCSQVIPDFETGFRQIFRMLNPNDYKEIIIIQANHSNALAIANLLLARLDRYGYPADQIKTKEVKVAPGDNGQMSAYIACRAMAKECGGKLIFSTSDFLSFGLVDALRDAKLEPGRDLDLISFDNLEGACGILPFGTPCLTSVNLPIERIAREATRLLLDLLENQDDRTHIIKIPTNLEIRDTTGKTLKTGIKNEQKIRFHTH